MLSHWKQGAQKWHTTKTVNFVKPVNFFKNRLRSLEPARNKGFYKHTLKISVFILSTNIWIFFESFISLSVFLKNWEIVFCLLLSRLEGNKRMGLCMVRHLLEWYVYLRKLTLLFMKPLVYFKICFNFIRNLVFLLYVWKQIYI